MLFPMRSGFVQRKKADLFVTMCKPYIPETMIFIGAADLAEHEAIAESWPDCNILNFDADDRVIEDVRTFANHVERVAVIGDPSVESVPFFQRKKKKLSSRWRVFAKAIPHEVKATTLEAIVENHNLATGEGQPIALWLDCEGSELDVLEGSEPIIRHVRWLCIEVSWGAPDGWPPRRQARKWLVDHGFVCTNMFGTFGYCQDHFYFQPRGDILRRTHGNVSEGHDVELVQE